ncbi:V-type proton ATPase subunit C 1-A-like [Ylistrum balloti]|uniref:V-type proton ATPase subunit C 1-A-like n=1 Tax=Ylistrum balloti TaxID=509963 RepID=UPI002905E600|nr:V-type proton ATPase subunit C 1-A-like [Ylistrum balloti]XP_060068199.1 V-type proton ATPase subunit C 1-A-like [Ylistrum balloti]
MTEFWLISAPGDKTCQQTWENLCNMTSRQNSLSTNYKFAIPDLKVGTLDILVGLSDELGKLDAYCESVTRKISHYMGEVLEDNHKLQENLLANGVDLVTYMTRFQWDLAKYPIKQSLRNISQIVSKQVSQIEGDLKSKASAYNNLKGSLQNLERKATGNLLTRNIGDLVKKEDFVLNSEYLQTLLVVVPKANQHDWHLKYETLTDMIVPRSTKVLFEDDENCLCSVTLFRRVVDEFKHKCRENRFMVRDFTYNEEELAAGKTEITKLEADKKKQFGPLVKWLKVNFGECFSAWIHVKALRVFVESVLRYGLPVNFQAMLLQPHRKSVRTLRSVLSQLYSHLDNTALAASSEGGHMDIPGLGMGNQEYYPYVYYKINLDLTEV